LACDRTHEQITLLYIKEVDKQHAHKIV